MNMGLIRKIINKDKERRKTEKKRGKRAERKFIRGVNHIVGCQGLKTRVSSVQKKATADKDRPIVQAKTVDVASLSMKKKISLEGTVCKNH